jgi:hypothetical protein
MAAETTPIHLARRNALLQIARCPLFALGGMAGSPCQTILGVQNNLPHAQRQVPEPWRGRLDSPLLFVSSNPSIDPDDDSPLACNSDEELVSYFEAGFPQAFPRVRLRNGNVRPNYVRFWASLRNRAAEIWNLPPNEIRPGLDFSITEIVHCKSQSEVGVTAALGTCKQLHWNTIISASSAQLIVVIGKVARDSFSLPFPIPVLQREVGLQNRWALTLPAPNSRRIQKKVSAHYSEQQLSQIRQELYDARL